MSATFFEMLKYAATGRAAPSMTDFDKMRARAMRRNNNNSEQPRTVHTRAKPETLQSNENGENTPVSGK